MICAQLCKRTPLVLFALILASFAPSASAELPAPCEQSVVLQGPVALSFEKGGFGEARRACPRSELSAGAAGRAIIDGDNFYGNLYGAMVVRGSFELWDGFEVFGRLEPIFYQQVIQSLSATNAGFGNSQLGLSLKALERNRLYVSTFGRVTFPTALSLYQNAYPLGLEVGLSARYRLLPKVVLHGNFVGSGETSLSLAKARARAGILTVVGSEFFFGDRLSLVGDVQSSALLRNGLDHVAVAGALRVKLFGHVSGDIAAIVPVAGSERHLANVGFNLRYLVR